MMHTVRFQMFNEVPNEAGCWPIKKQHVHKIKIAVMRMFIWTCHKTRLDNIRIKRIWKQFRDSINR